MFDFLDKLPDIRLHRALPSEKTLNLMQACVVLFAEGADWERLPCGALLRRRWRRGSGKNRVLFTELPNTRGTRVSLACVGELSSFDLLELCRRLCAAHRGSASALHLVPFGFKSKESLRRTTEALLAAALAGSVCLPSYKARAQARPTPSALHLYGASDRRLVARCRAEAAGNALARALCVTPGNLLTPGIYLRHLRRLARQEGWKLQFLDMAALRRRGAGAFVAVGQGAPEAQSGIVHLHWEGGGPRARAPRIALVGKGLCYDTGGVNLKSPRHMFGMHEDMTGSAVALGVLYALTHLQVHASVDCWLALASNEIGPRSYKPNDVVKALNGLTIEVVDTDAEGRMVLADTLTLAARRKPKLLLDFATLTGACVYALGTRYSGAFSNRLEFLPELIASGHECGERVWPFPMDKDYDKALHSDVADLRQCAREGGLPDHILAARFLQHFVPPEVPWIHLDLASAQHKGGLAHIPTESTGFGVRLALHLLLDRGLASGS